MDYGTGDHWTSLGIYVYVWLRAKSPWARAWAVRRPCLWRTAPIQQQWRYISAFAGTIRVMLLTVGRCKPPSMLLITPNCSSRSLLSIHVVNFSASFCPSPYHVPAPSSSCSKTAWNSLELTSEYRPDHIACNRSTHYLLDQQYHVF